MSSDAPPRAEVAIAVRGLRKSFRTDFWKPRIEALRRLDLEVMCGESFGFIGPNGAGKTTMIKILMGLVRPSAGTAWVMGFLSTDPRSRARVGFLPERPYFYQHLTARELLHFYGELFGMAASERQRRIEGLLERVGMRRFGDVPLRKYSKGMLQRIGLCQALLSDPELIILDEPMSGLDPMGRATVRDLLLEHREKGRTVFFSSHILHDVETLCDRVGLMVRGELRGAGTIQSLIGDRIRHTDCTFVGAPDVVVPGEAIGDERDPRIVRVTPDEVPAVIAAVQTAGGRIVQIQPIRETLEGVLQDEVDRASPVRPEQMGVLA